MKQTILSVACHLYLISATMAFQTKSRILISAKEDTLSKDFFYDLPDFAEGTIFYRDGSSSTHFINYRFLVDEMQILSDKGDTLALSEPELIKEIIVGSITYYYDKGYLKQVVKKGYFRLATRKKVQISVKTGGGKDAFAASSISLKEINYFPVETYYLGDRNNNFRKATKNVFLHLFGDKKSIRAYINENNIDFKNPVQLVDLFNFCAAS